MTCKSCSTELTCRTKDYGGNYEPKLQWQNEDGTAHYATKDGKDFTCNIPESALTFTNTTTTAGNTVTFSPSYDEKLDAINTKLERIYSMIAEQYREYQDRKENQE